MNKKNNSNLCNISEYRFSSFDKEFSDSLTITEINAAIARSFIAYRKKNKMTQHDLALKLGVNQSMIAKLERGDYNPSMKFLFETSNKLTGDYSFFINVLSEIRKIAKQNDEKNKEIAKQVKNKKKTRKQYFYYEDTVLPISKVSEEPEDYKS